MNKSAGKVYRYTNKSGKRWELERELSEGEICDMPPHNYFGYAVKINKSGTVLDIEVMNGTDNVNNWNSRMKIYNLKNKIASIGLFILLISIGIAVVNISELLTTAFFVLAGISIGIILLEFKIIK